MAQITTKTDKKSTVLGMTVAQADAKYLPINTMIPTNGITVAQADARYHLKTTVPLTITLEMDKRYLLQAPPLTTVAAALDKKKDK